MRQSCRAAVSGFRDLAPTIMRQRLVLEGTRQRRISEHEIVEYLCGLSDVCAMTVLMDPVTHRSERYGWAGWIHWETSGAHFYAWDEPFVFFSVDIYTCKAFEPDDAIAFTRVFLDADEVVAKEA
ncbi:MAG: S-adenosylmethionine decarboxylase [Acidimicrobiia bacterium]